ncbi:PorP/SprF family type IX secretion system membrane protein [Flavobacterium xinjiangense]|uniref:Type IX secretion system membrane protein, PorP/SprF family n=1 Tax=Flavobacterium xinjiangense TaxID=178356 RepID=A0A1M7PGG5_9FLAO|nr:PorP/SprF family type IX secretion system membrane protein [Flavobacterium xinjiangense]SHN16129.1 type IX secretion system membrane protein, PorP/SprF family [Flavobacterium xinjiangense]
MIKNRVEKGLMTFVSLICTIIGMQKGSAQSSRPLGAQFYENQYLSNPAFAGMEYGLNLNLNYRNQWRSIAGSPVTMSISGDYRFKSVGVGLNIYKDEAGLLGKTQIKGTYAYHLPLYGDRRDLHFGLSLAVMHQNLDDSNVIAESGDVLVDQFNQRKSYLDGDFGIVYTTERLTLQATLPNLGRLFFHKNEQNTINGFIYLTAVSYKIGTDLDALSIEPKISVRGAKGVDNIVDIGSNVKLKRDMLSFMAMYHSDNSATLGLGLNYDKFFVQFFYTSQQTNNRENFGGDFEINLKINLLK